MTKVKSRKDVIKNIAIVFLVIMLVLTFFSNTIMNYSLAEVNGKYSEYGTIRTGVRGSGTVQANTVFEQAVKGDQRVVEVFVREGDRVTEGQVLMTLEPSAVADNTAELEALKEQLESLKDAYDRALLSRDGDADYTLAEMDIADAREELDLLIAKRGEFTEEKLLAIATEYENAEKAVEELAESIETLEEQIAEVSAESDDPAIVTAREKVASVKNVLKYAEEQLAKAEEDFNGVSYTDLTSLNSQKDSISRSLGKLYDNEKALETKYADLLALKPAMDKAKTDFDKARGEYEALYGAFDPETQPEITVPENPDENEVKRLEAWKGVKALYTAYETAKGEWEANEDDIASAEAEIEAVEDQIADLNYDYSAVTKQISSAKSENKLYDKYKASVELCEDEVENVKKNLESAEKALEDAVEGIAKDLTASLKTKRAELKTAEKHLTEAAADKEEADGVEGLDEEIKSKERALFEMEYNLEKQKESDAKANELEDYDFKKQKEEIDSLQAEIYKLQGNTAGGETEFVSKYNGTVTAFTCRVGDTLSDGSSVISIESEENGYTLSFSVSNADSRKLQIGDTATVSGGYWGSSISAVLTTLKTQPGGQSKLATFDLSGDVVSGQTLTLIAGEKSTSYSSVVPKSAIREDSNGKFIYITKTKSTPLGNRYVATRLPVEIVASDDVNAAITSPEISYIYEFAITSSTKPIADGDYVRLAD
ncbi:MAG: biotin/lipoyl-binding protein [Clostridia bacterium]|nr:biotin/lipoyl-binding protein [Clostridia bacterium]